MNTQITTTAIEQAARQIMHGVANSTVYGGIGGEEMARFVTNGAELTTPNHARIKAEIDAVLRPFRQPPGDATTTTTSK